MTDRELEYLRKVYLKAEVDIINEIARLRSRGLVDYHAVAALERVQKILLSLQDVAWKYAPRMIEKYFYANHPERYTRAPKTAAEHLIGYQSAESLTSTEINATQRLVFSYISTLENASANILTGLTGMLLGRHEADQIRSAGLEAALQIQATGMDLGYTDKFIEQLKRDGVTAFVDKAGRHWSLHTYADMVTRTIAKQASTLAVLLKDEKHDLYYIPMLGTTCSVCAPLEGRVYSKSGLDPDFPPLSRAYGKIDPLGPDTLENSWLNIHPNCLHPLVPWTPAGKTEEQLKEIKRRSQAPFDVDPRSEAQVKAYNDNQAARAKWLADFNQFEKYRLAIPDKMPKTFQTFQKHKLADDDKYKAWVQAYRELTSKR